MDQPHASVERRRVVADDLMRDQSMMQADQFGSVFSHICLILPHPRARAFAQRVACTPYRRLVPFDILSELLDARDHVWPKFGFTITTIPLSTAAGDEVGSASPGHMDTTWVVNDVWVPADRRPALTTDCDSLIPSSVTRSARSEKHVKKLER